MFFTISKLVLVQNTHTYKYKIMKRKSSWLLLNNQELGLIY